MCCWPVLSELSSAAEVLVNDTKVPAIQNNFHTRTFLSSFQFKTARITLGMSCGPTEIRLMIGLSFLLSALNPSV